MSNDDHIDTCDIRNANTVKELVLLALFEDGVISKESYDVVRKTYVVNVAKKFWMFRWFANKEGPIEFIVSKLIVPREKESEIYDA